MYGWLDLVRNDELDGGGLERVLWIKPDHEVKNLILEKCQKCQYQKRGSKGRGAGRWEMGHEERVRSRSKITSVTVNDTLYKLSPRTSIEKNHVLRSSACNSWIPVRDDR